MPIRYHAQRKHVVHSIDSLLYELHTLSFLLSPSIFVLLCRCITQFQFVRVRELDGRRSLRFWFVLVLLVNASAVWTHAIGASGSGVGGRGGGGSEKGVVLDFVGMGYKPARSQLLFLDATIIFLQAILTTISYETSLTLAMPPDSEDPLLPSSPLQPNTDLTEETAPFLPYTSPDSSIVPTSSGTTYPPTPPIASSSSFINLPSSSTGHPSFDSTKRKPRDPLPPRKPIINLSLRHVIHRLMSPIPEPPARTGSGANQGLDEGDDELAMLRLPLPNTTSVRVASTLRMLAMVRQRQRQNEREQQNEARRLRRGGSGSGTAGERRGRGRDLGDDDNSRGEERARGGRIPGAIEDEDEG